MGKIRVSQHSGRSGSASHNDRSFLKEMTAEEKIEKAAHIDESLMSQNETWAWNGNTEDFKQGELDYYKQTFQAGIDRTNENYIRSRHPERCKKLEDYYFSEKTCPEEMILQIGDKNTEVSKEVFQACMSDYWAWFNQWNAEHGYPCQILNTALHTDETSIHEHIRRVWKYTDDKGFLRLGQNKALKAAGVELPDPSKKESRYNNRKITFDKMAREKWQEICKAHGFDIETDPRPNAKHKDKAEYIADQMAKEQQEQKIALETVKQDLATAENRLQTVTEQSKIQTDFLVQTENKLAEASESLFKTENDVKGAISTLEALEGKIQPLQKQFESLTSTNETLQAENKLLGSEKDRLDHDISVLDKELDKTQDELDNARNALKGIDKEIADKSDSQRLLRMIDTTYQMIKDRQPYAVEVYAEHEPKYNPITKKQTKPATVEVTKTTFDSYLQDQNLIQILSELLNRLLELFRSIKQALKLEVVKEQAYQEINGKLQASEERNTKLQIKNMDLSVKIDSLKGDKVKLQAEIDIKQTDLDNVQDKLDRLEERFPGLSKLERICEYERLYENRSQIGHDYFGKFCLPDPDGEEVRIWYFMKEYAAECKALHLTPREDIDEHYAKYHNGEHLLEAISDDHQEQDRGYYL